MEFFSVYYILFPKQSFAMEAELLQFVNRAERAENEIHNLLTELETLEENIKRGNQNTTNEKVMNNDETEGEIGTVMYFLEII